VDGTNVPERARYLYVHMGLNKTEVEHAEAGEIIALAGLEGLPLVKLWLIPENPVALPTIKSRGTNCPYDVWGQYSPFSGREGRWSYFTETARAFV